MCTVKMFLKITSSQEDVRTELTTEQRANILPVFVSLLDECDAFCPCLPVAVIGSAWGDVRYLGVLRRWGEVRR